MMMTGQAKALLDAGSSLGNSSSHTAKRNLLLLIYCYNTSQETIALLNPRGP